MKYYTGIGSRETPPGICAEMISISIWLANKDYVLRSGHTFGADMAFEHGAEFGKKEIYIPWHGFNNAGKGMLHTNFIVPRFADEWIHESVNTFHPSPSSLTQGAWKMMARNACQVLGLHGVTPSKFVICWTKEAKFVGGTSQAMRIAQHHDIPIINMAREEFSTAIKVIEVLKKGVI